MLDFTTATREQRQKAYDAIAAQIGDDRFFTTKELDVLPKILAPFEQVLSFSSGLMDGDTWLIVLTDQRVLFVDKGMIYGLKQTSIELSSIVNIQGETHLLVGTIRVADAAGSHEIRNCWKRTVNPFVNKVREAMDAHRRGVKIQSPGTQDEAPPPAPAAPPPTPPAPPPPPPPPTPQPVPPPPISTRQPIPASEWAPVETPRPAPAPAPPAPVPTGGEADRRHLVARLDRLLRAGAIDQTEHARQSALIR